MRLFRTGSSNLVKTLTPFCVPFKHREKTTKMGRFSSGLFACLSDPGVLLLSCCGPPLLIGKNAEAIGENPTLWALTSFSPVTNALLRNQIRKKQGTFWFKF